MPQVNYGNQQRADRLGKIVTENVCAGRPLRAIGCSLWETRFPPEKK